MNRKKEMTSALHSLFQRLMRAAFVAFIGLCLVLTPLEGASAAGMLSGDYVQDTVYVSGRLQEIVKDSNNDVIKQAEAESLINEFISNIWI